MVYQIKEKISTLNNMEYVRVEVDAVDRLLKTPKNTSQATIDAIIDQEVEEEQEEADAERHCKDASGAGKTHAADEIGHEIAALRQRIKELRESAARHEELVMAIT